MKGYLLPASRVHVHRYIRYVCIWLCHNSEPSLPLCLCLVFLRNRPCFFSSLKRHAGEQADRQTDNMYRAKRFDDIEIAYLFVPYLLLFIPSTCCCCSFSFSSGSVGGEGILQCRRGFLSLVGEFEMWCLQEISIRTSKVSRTTWRSAFSFGVFVEWGERARSISFSLSLYVSRD